MRTDFIEHERQFHTTPPLKHVLLQMRTPICQWISSIQYFQHHVREVHNRFEVWKIGIHQDGNLFVSRRQRFVIFSFAGTARRLGDKREDTRVWDVFLGNSISSCFGSFLRLFPTLLLFLCLSNILELTSKNMELRVSTHLSPLLCNLSQDLILIREVVGNARIFWVLYARRIAEMRNLKSRKKNVGTHLSSIE